MKTDECSDQLHSKFTMGEVLGINLAVQIVRVANGQSEQIKGCFSTLGLMCPLPPDILFFLSCQAHHCGAFIQKHSSIVPIFLSLTH